MIEQKVLRDAMKVAFDLEQERKAREIAEAQIRVVTAAFDKAAAYNNLMLLAGYAGFFGLWHLAQPYLSKWVVLWSALLVLFSLASFIIFEVVKMFTIQKGVMKQAKALRSKDNLRDPDRLLKALNKLGAQQEMSTKSFMSWWAASFVFSVGTGLSGAGVLAYAFVAGLVN